MTFFKRCNHFQFKNMSPTTVEFLSCFPIEIKVSAWIYLFAKFYFLRSRLGSGTLKGLVSVFGDGTLNSAVAWR